MKDYSAETVRSMGRRSSLALFAYTTLVALVGAAATIITGHVFVVWIPLCFGVIPLLHHLCRELLRLQERVRELEKRLGASNPDAEPARIAVAEPAQA